MKLPKNFELPSGSTSYGINVAALTGESASQTERAKDGQTGKYGNTKTVEDGIVFDSANEAARYRILRSLHNVGAILVLSIQPRFDIRVRGVHICYYKADFSYVMPSGEVVIEDVKSEPTRLKASYRLKLKLMRAVHGITVREVVTTKRGKR